MKKAPFKLHLKKDDIVQVITGKEKEIGRAHV